MSNQAPQAYQVGLESIVRALSSLQRSGRVADLDRAIDVLMRLDPAVAIDREIDDVEHPTEIIGADDAASLEAHLRSQAMLLPGGSARSALIDGADRMALVVAAVREAAPAAEAAQSLISRARLRP